jgi:hypothetical protein
MDSSQVFLQLKEENDKLLAALQLSEAQKALAIAEAYKDKVKLGVPAQFHGDLNTDPRQWLDSMELYLTQSYTPRNRWPGVAATYLKGPAFTWFGSLPTESKATLTWEAFTSGLMARFRPVDNDRIGRSRLMTLRMKASDRGAGISQYVNRFLTLCNSVKDLGENEKFAYFSQGLTPDLQRSIVALTNVNTVTEAISAVMRIEALTPPTHYNNMENRERSSYRTPMNSFVRRTEEKQEVIRGDSNVKTTSTPTGGSSPMELGSMEEEDNPTTDEELGVMRGPSNNRGSRLGQAEVEEYMRKGLCFRCKKPGHIKRNCPSNPLNGAARK